MDGEGGCLAYILIERLWRSLQYECVYLRAWETVLQADAGISRWISLGCGRVRRSDCRADIFDARQRTVQNRPFPLLPRRSDAQTAQSCLSLQADNMRDHDRLCGLDRCDFIGAMYII